MAEPFNVTSYAAYLLKRWRFIAVACASAGAIALIGSLLMPERFTASVNVVIEPADPRSANVISPMYLESLRMYETFASSDAAFEKALQRFHIQSSSSLESQKKKILEVSKLRDTRILRISATLPDAHQALEFAQYLADQTIQLNQSVTTEVRKNSLQAAEDESARAAKATQTVEIEWSAFKERGSIDALQDELVGLSDLKSHIRREAVTTAAEAPGGASSKAALLSKQADKLDQEFDRKSAHLAAIIARRDALQEKMDTVRRIQEGTEIKLRELRAAAGLQGDYLRIIDNGVVPTKPSSPKTLLNVEAAVLLALVASVVFLSFAFTSERRNSRSTEPFRLHA